MLIVRVLVTGKVMCVGECLGLSVCRLSPLNSIRLVLVLGPVAASRCLLRKTEPVLVRKYSVRSLLSTVLCLVESCITEVGTRTCVIVTACMNLKGLSLIVLVSGALVMCIRWPTGIELGRVGRAVSVMRKLV